ncbi:hypothetical protein ABE47_34475 [Bacillus thuringiensis]|nr:hypothetical protein [Bacillus thuringiensis]MBG9517024.1 hypothetical protein [Bacillus thuringiensis]MBH0336281.1 hypothetical protein [Bacillus thuringiensis]
MEDVKMEQTQVLDMLAINVEADLGNSNLKIFVNNEYVTVPNVFKRVHGAIESYEPDIDKNVMNLLDELYVHITSCAIERDGSFLVGERAMKKGRPKGMNIDYGKKHAEDLPIISVLSVVAAKVIQQIYKEKKTLPKVLSLNVDLITAIPASQHTPDTAKMLSNRFQEKEHVVIVYIGGEKVTVQIEFSRARVTKEGATSLFAMIDGEQDMYKEFQNLYQEKLKGIEVTGEYFTNKKILHVDIGDGTTEYIYTINQKPVLGNCTGERQGIGHALEKACKLLNKKRDTNYNRHQFAQIVLHDNKDQEDAQGFLYETRYEESESIIESVEEKYNEETAGQAEIIAVYGGGSIGLRAEFYNKILKFCDKRNILLFYVPEKYAITMNPLGMNKLRKAMDSK